MATNYFKQKKKLEEMMYTDPTVTVVEDENGKKVSQKPSASRNYNDIAPVKVSLMDMKTDITAPFKPINNRSMVTNDDPIFGERSWFQKGALGDEGNPFVRSLRTVYGTQADIKQDLVRGVYKGLEGILDFGAAGVARVSDALGNEEFSKKTRDFIARDLESELGLSQRYADQSLQGVASKILNGESINPFKYDKKASTYEKDSILGAKSDSLVQSAGQLGLTIGGQAIGVPWFVTTGLTTYGGELENAYNAGATANEASISAAISAGAEILTEKLSGGISFGGKTLDERMTKALSKKISDMTLRNLSRFGLDVVGEGTEEVLSDVISNIGKKLTYEDEKTWKDILTSEEALDGYLESFIGGAVLGGSMNIPKLASSIKTGRDYDTGLTDNEQKVVDSEVQKRTNEKKKTRAIEDRINQVISEREGTFGTLTDAEKKTIRDSILSDADSIDFSNSQLSKKEIEKIESEVREDLEKGNFEIESIEDTLTGDLTARIRELKVQQEQTTNAEEKAQIESQIGKLEDAKNSQMLEMLQKDNLLQNSYREANLRKQQFTYEPTEKDSEYRKNLASDFSRIANDSTKSHELFETLAKISEDKQTQYGVINNEQLKELGYEVDGKDINGLVRTNADGTQKVLINMDSSKAINRIVGHETTHLLEGTQEYTELQDMVEQYAKTKGDYDAKIKEFTKLYDGVEGADVKAEVTSELVGDYLFTDADFVNQLSVQKPNIFQKMFNEIKHLYKLATAGSKEARELEKVKKAFEKAYQQNVQGTDAATKFSINEAQEGFKYVDVDTSIYDNSDGETVAQVLSDIITNKFNNLVEANGQSIVLNQKTNREWGHSKEANSLKKNAPDVYSDKLKTLGNADEILTAANRWIGEERAHSRKDSFVEFARGEIFYKVGDTGYGADVIVGTRADGSAVLYDVVNIGETKITGVPHTSESIMQSTDRSGTPAVDNVAQNGNIVNTDDKFSLSEGDGFIRTYNQRDKVTDSLEKRLNEEYSYKKPHYVDGIPVTFDYIHKSGGMGSLATFYVNMTIGEESNNAESLTIRYSGHEPRYGDYDRSIQNKDIKSLDDLYTAVDEVVADYVNELPDWQREELRNEFAEQAKNTDAKFSLSATDENLKDVFGFKVSEKANVNEDVLEELSIHDPDAKVDENGNITVYHRTTAENAEKIRNSGIMTAQEDALFFSSKDAGEYNSDYGEAVVKLSVPSTVLEVNDIFDGEVHFDIPLKRKNNQWQLDVSDYLVKEETPKYSLSERNEAYQKAVENNDVETAQRLVDEAAKENGYTVKAYHGTLTEGITEFKKEFIGSRYSFDEVGFFFTNNQNIANDYASADYGDRKGEVIPAYLKTENPLVVDANFALSNGLGKIFRDNDAIDVWDSYQSYLLEEAESIRADSIVVDDGYSKMIVVFKPNQIKSAKPVVYDNDGNVIPLSQRFSSWKNDIRYSLSNKGEQFAPVRGDIFGRDIKYNEPVQETVEEIAPVKEQPVVPAGAKIDDTDYAPITDIEGFNQQSAEAFDSLAYEDAPEAITHNTDSFNDTVTIDKKSLNEMTKNIGNYLGLNRQSKNTLKEILQSLSNNEFRSKAELYNELEKNFGTQYTEEVNRELADAKIYLRDYKINVSPMVQGDIPDYGKFMRRNFGKIRFSKEGNSVDVVYQDLANTYPALFPEDIVTESDQLLRIAEVVNTPTKDLIPTTLPAEALQDATDFIYDSVQSYADSEKLIAANEYANTPIDESLAPYEEPVKESAPVEDVAPVKETAKEKPIENKKAAPSNEEIAKVLTTEPKTESQRNKRKLAILAANVLDKGLVFENISLKEKNRDLMGKWDYMLTSESRAQNVIGNGHTKMNPETKTIEQTSKSLDAIREEVDNSGKTQDFYNYMYHKHNVDRMNLADRYEGVENKPVFGERVDSATSQAIVNQYEAQNPEFLTWAQDVYDYLNADRQHLVDTGVISRETADLWQQMYPHYVPIRRVDSKGVDINVPLDTRRTGINAPVKRAIGGSTDILPLFDTIAQRTLQTYKASAKNSFGNELMDILGTEIDSTKTNVDEVIDSIDTQESLLQHNDGNPTFTVFTGGDKHTFEITQDMYDALSPVSDSSLLSKTFAVPNKIAAFHRGVLTQYNPMFTLTNFAKDVQDVLVNSQHPAKTYAKFGESMAQLVKKGYWYQEYLANGGEQNSYFDSQENTFKTEKSFSDKILDLPPLKQIAQVNDFVEMIPRLSEYIASRESGRSIEVSMLDAARVTTNFKAGGNLTKFLNRNGATFLNASVQGAMQQVRNVREAKANGLKGWVGLAAKFAAAGAPALLLNALLWDDDDDYEELSDYVKQNYYIVAKDDEGNFIRIPKGRTLAVIQNGIEQMQNLITGDDEVDLAQFIDLVINNLAPNNPITNNVISPIVQVAQNKTWYGGDLVPKALQDLPAAEQYDESTDSFSKWLGETFGISPYKANYLINQYSGGVGDVIQPMMTPEATNDAETLGEQLLAPLKSKFTTNAIMNNQNVSDFWDKAEELTTNAKKSAHTDEDVLSNKYFTSVKSEISDLNAQKKEVQNSNLSKSEKYSRIKQIQTQINELAKNALSEHEDVEISDKYATVSDRQYRIDKNGEWSKISDKQIEKQQEVTDLLGVSAKDYWNSDEDTREVYSWAVKNPEKYQVSRAVTDNVVTYRKYAKELDELKSDKDSNGKSISGSRKEKVASYINNLNADYGAKIILYKSEYEADDTYNNDIVEYLNGRNDITYEQMVAILTELGMTVDSDGNVYW